MNKDYPLPSFIHFHFSVIKRILITTYITLIVSLATTGFSFGQDTLAIKIAKFKDNKDCAISYTFDDGLKEHATLVAPFLNSIGLTGTFVINGSKINKDDNHITDTTRMTWTELKKMASEGHEISNHGWAHRNFGKFTLAEIQEDILKNDSAVFANIGIMPRTFAYPNNTKTVEGVKLAAENRVGTRTFQRSLGGKSTTEDLEKWVSKLLKDHDWGVTMTHGITYGYDHFTSQHILWEHLKKVKAMEDKVWVGTFHDVISYVTERDSTILSTKKIGEGHYLLTTTCSLDKNLFKENLTALIVKKGIKAVQIRQGKSKIKPVVTGDQILFAFDPFGGTIDIKTK